MAQTDDTTEIWKGVRFGELYRIVPAPDTAESAYIQKQQPDGSWFPVALCSTITRARTLMCVDGHEKR